MEYWALKYLNVIGCVTAVAGCAILSACEHDTQATEKRANAIEDKLDIVIWCQSTSELKRFYSGDTADAQIQSLGNFVFVQVFPYSGMRASDLYVYSRGTDGLSFVSYVFQVPDVRPVELKLNETGTVEVWCRDRRYMVFDKHTEG